MLMNPIDSKTMAEFSHPVTQWYFVKNDKWMAWDDVLKKFIVDSEKIETVKSAFYSFHKNKAVCSYF